MKTFDGIEYDNFDFYLQQKLEKANQQILKVVEESAHHLAISALKEGFIGGLNVSSISKYQHCKPGAIYFALSNSYYWFGEKRDLKFHVNIDLLKDLKDEKCNGNFGPENRQGLLDTVDVFRKCIDYIERNLPPETA